MTQASTHGITKRIDAITAIAPERRTDRLPAPRSVKIELTGKCNFRCGFCALRTRPKQPNDTIDWDLLVRVTYEMRAAGVEEVGLFFLGESFTAPDLLVRAIAHCKVLGFPYLFVTTNGSLASPDRLERVMAAGLDSLKFSINWADAEQFKDIAGVSAKLWRRALDNLRAAHELRDRRGFATRIYASSIAYDGDQREKMQELLASDVLPYVDEHYFLPLYSMGAFATQREEELGYRPIAGNQGRLGALREPLPCWSVFTEGHVTSRGMLSACCFDAGDKWAMADLRKVSFMDGWNSKPFMALRRAHLRRDVSDTICRDCIAYVQ
jgi:MoaA/NifB/PqqE/SkfB family radical SAM enzyme